MQSKIKMNKIVHFFARSQSKKSSSTTSTLSVEQQVEMLQTRITPETQLFGVPVSVACKDHPSHSSSDCPPPYQSFISQHLPLPFPVFQCLNFLDNLSLTEPGLYRIPGSLSRVRWFRARMDCGEYVNFEQNEEPGTVTSLLLAFLREIPGGLVPEEIRTQLHGINAHSENPEKSVSEILTTMDEPRQRVLGALVDHLHRVALHCEVNRMTSNNLAICVFPWLENPFVAILLIDKGSALFRPTQEEPTPPPRVGRRASMFTRSTESIWRAFNGTRPKSAKWRTTLLSPRATVTTNGRKHGSMQLEPDAEGLDTQHEGGEGEDDVIGDLTNGRLAHSLDVVQENENNNTPAAPIDDGFVRPQSLAGFFARSSSLSKFNTRRKSLFV